MHPTIRFDDIRRAFGRNEVLCGLSLAVRPGEVYALLGRNGAGKTTAIRVLVGFLQADAGSCSVLGADSTRLTPVLRDRIGYVGEGQALYPWMRVSEVLAFEQGTRRRFDREHARRLLERLGLEPDRRVDALSRGARAQLALTVAVASRPEVLILDDPAAGLDAVVRREFLEVMIDVIGEQGCAVLFSSHVLSDVERVADRVGLLQGGRLLVDATLDDLKRRVERRRVRTAGRPPAVAGLLAARAVGQGYELTLLDHDAERHAQLAEAVTSVSAPETPSLEELFLDLLGRHAGDAPTDAPSGRRTEHETGRPYP
jgi:ABC-2 type transport system ATP-binding protein